MSRETDVNGTVYLLHFSGRLKHAQHYIGWTMQSPAMRLQDHVNGHGSALIKAVVAAGLTVEIVRTWPGETRAFERKLKNRAYARRICPICAAAEGRKLVGCPGSPAAVSLP